MKKMISLAILAVVMVAAVPAFAAESATSGILSYKEFAALSENRGTPVGRMLDRKYEEYRQGRAPSPTLSVTELR